MMRRSSPLQRVPCISKAARLSGDPVVAHEALELRAGILAALIGMMQQSIWFSSTPDCHYQSICDELGRHGGIHRPTGDTA
jgi:hypothetical protein